MCTDLQRPVKLLFLPVSVATLRRERGQVPGWKGPRPWSRTWDQEEVSALEELDIIGSDVRCGMQGCYQNGASAYASFVLVVMRHDALHALSQTQWPYI